MHCNDTLNHVCKDHGFIDFPTDISALAVHDGFSTILGQSQHPRELEKFQINFNLI